MGYGAQHFGKLVRGINILYGSKFGGGLLRKGEIPIKMTKHVTKMSKNEKKVRKRCTFEKLYGGQ